MDCILLWIVFRSLLMQFEHSLGLGGESILDVHKISEFCGFIFKFLNFRLGTSSLHQKVGLLEFSRSC